jgi:hypothetical protein
MMYEDSHLSDEQLLLDVDGELSRHDEQLVRTHIEDCWKCRARRQEIEAAIGDFVHVHQQEFDTKLPPAAGPRALLKARLAQLSAIEPKRASGWFIFARRFAWATALFGLLSLGLLLVRSPRPRAVVVSIPDARLTPGATLLVGRQAVCAQVSAKNKAVPAALQRKVFEEYGIAGADPRAYEVDYLVTPALGGADDIHNLWPHSYSATVWNARVKDALEDHLREQVCDGSLDLMEAQREIATNWIAAYQKYFRTDKPLAEHRGQSIQ